MERNKIKKIFLWVSVIVLFATYVYFYVSNPLQKKFNLGLFGFVFPLLFFLLQFLLKKNRFKREAALLIASVLLIVIYLTFL